MTQSASVTGTGSDALAYRPAVSASSNAPTPASQTAQAAASGASVAISPRIIMDPVVGMITQYLDSKGVIQVQLPSVAAVAYLKAGLTADGSSKDVPAQAPHAQPATTVA